MGGRALLMMHQPNNGMVLLGTNTGFTYVQSMPYALQDSFSYLIVAEKQDHLVDVLISVGVHC